MEDQKVVVRGIVHPDGKIEISEPVGLPPGPVILFMRPLPVETEKEEKKDD